MKKRIKIIMASITLIMFYVTPIKAVDWSCVGSGENWAPFASNHWLGVIKGSFYEMGSQYGERGAFDILINTDADWKSSLKYFNYDVILLKGILEKFRKQLWYYSPQTIEFMKGRAAGAASQLKNSPYASTSTNFERILQLNISSAIRKMPIEHECNSFWVSSGATVDGKAIVSHHSQSSMGTGKSGRNFTFVAIPDDPDAQIVWVSTNAGCIGRGGQMINDEGVMNALHASQQGSPKGCMDYGVEFHVSRFHAAFYGKTAENAADFLVHGTKRYRDFTGMKTLLRTRGAVIMFADATTCIYAQFAARNYALRKPGDMGEINANYIAQSNHNYSVYSYDENDKYTEEVKMTDFANEDGNSSSYFRFWSPMEAIKNAYGLIDKKKVIHELTSLHETYNKDGKPYGYQPGKTFCVHSYKSGNPGSSYNPVVFIPENLEIYNVPYWPCNFKNKSWNYYNLNNYKGLRKEE